MGKYILSIDIGTTSVKAALLSEDYRIVTQQSREHHLVSPHPGWAEEDANIWWENTKYVIQAITSSYPNEARNICGIGVSGMVPAIVLLDRAGNVLRKTIQQNDARAVNQIARLQVELDQKELYQRTGGVTNQQHVLPRLLWLQENDSMVWGSVATIFGSYDYIVYKLTGERSLELNWAIESGMYDIHQNTWISSQFEKYQLNPEIFPPVQDPGNIVGTVKSHLCQELGLPANTEVIAGSADHVASAYAAGIVAPNDLLIKFGGAGDILFGTDEKKTNEKLFFDSHVIPGQYLLNGCMAASGSLVKWYVKDLLRAENDPQIYQRMDQAASAVPPASDGLIVLPYFLGEKTPIFDPIARGVIFGLTLSHTTGHVFRAILESVIYGFRHHLDEMKAMGYCPNRIYATDGGAKSALWCQIAADVLGHEIVAYPGHPGSSLGVGYLAGMSVGVYKNWEDILQFLKKEYRYTPNTHNFEIYNNAYEIYRNLYEQTKPLLPMLNSIYK